MESGHGLNKGKEALLIHRRRCIVAYTAGNDKELPDTDLHRPTIFLAAAKMERALEDEEEFILLIMNMPGKLALNANDLDKVIVETTDDAWGPELKERRRGLDQ